MKTGVFAALALVSLVVLSAIILVMSFFNFKMELNRNVNGLDAQYQVNQSIYDNGYKKVLEIAQVPAMYEQALKNVVVAAIQGRYGKDGAQQVFLTIQEQNPNVDPSMFIKIQQTIEIFRNQFTQSQTELQSRVQVAKDLVNGTWRGTLFAGFVQIPDWKKYDVVTSGRTANAFDTKKDEPLELQPKTATPPQPPQAETTAAKPKAKRQLPKGTIVAVPSGGQLPPR